MSCKVKHYLVIVFIWRLSLIREIYGCPVVMGLTVVVCFPYFNLAKLKLHFPEFSVQSQGRMAALHRILQVEEELLPSCAL